MIQKVSRGRNVIYATTYKTQVAEEGEGFPAQAETAEEISFFVCYEFSRTENSV